MVAMLLLLLLLAASWIFNVIVPNEGPRTRLQKERHRLQRERLYQAADQEDVFEYHIKIDCDSSDAAWAGGDQESNGGDTHGIASKFKGLTDEERKVSPHCKMNYN